MTHSVTANCLITIMILKSLLKKLMSDKVAKKSYKLKYHHARVSVAATAATLIIIGEAVVTNLTPAITTPIVSSALKELKTTPAVKSKVAVSSTSTSAIGKTTGKTSGPTKNTRAYKGKYSVGIIIICSRTG